MFLSRSSLIKTVLISSLFLLIGIIFFILAYFIGKGDTSPRPTLITGIVMTCISAASVFIGIYGDGVSKPFAEGTLLVRKNLQPKKYIELYEEKTKENGYVIARPRFDMLELLYTAYELLDDKRGMAFVISEMKSKMKPSYKGKIAVYAADQEYRSGHTAEGDKLLSYAEQHDSSSTVLAMSEAVKKTSRAEAEGDFSACEAYYSGLLSASGIFKADNSAALLAHYRLYRVCKSSGFDDEAEKHLKYCAEHGGDTVICQRAKALI